MSAILQYANTYHAYVFGTSFWYFLRGIMRIIDPATVCDWFRPPIQSPAIPTDLELYTIWTDGFCLLALSGILLTISDALPLPQTLKGPQLVAPSATPGAKKPYARAIILVTILHHVATGYGAGTHWIRPGYNNIAMDIGVYGNVALTVLGVVALGWGLEEGEEGMELRSGKKLS